MAALVALAASVAAAASVAVVATLVVVVAALVVVVVVVVLLTLIHLFYQTDIMEVVVIQARVTEAFTTQTCAQRTVVDTTTAIKTVIIFVAKKTSNATPIEILS